MSTYDLDLKLQQSSCQSGVKASVTCVLSDQERFYTHTDKSRFQNESEQEKLNPGPSAQHIHNKKDLETGTTASSPALPLTGQQKSSKNLQIKQIILLRTKRDSSRTSEEQTESDRFTSTISISLPTRTRKKDTAEEKPLQVTTNLYNTHEVVKNTANQHGTEIRDVFSPAEKCDKSAGELFKLGDGPKATFDGDSFTILHQHVHNTPKQGQNTGIQHNIGLHEQSQIIHDSLRHSTQPVCEVETEVNKDFGSNDCGKNASTTAQYHNNLTSIGVDNELKESSDSQLVACHAEVLNQVLTLASFTAPASDNTPEPEPSLFNPSSAMLTSTLASVLAPPWSGRLRRPKQGSNEVPQDSGQNINPSSLFHQDRQQPLFLRSQRQPSEHMLASNNQMQLTAGTGFNSPDWQKENNSPNVTTTVQPKRPILKSSVGTMYNTELHSFSTPLDTCHAPNSSHSGHRISQTGEEHEPFKSLSSKPTTSSLLLSLRRTNLRNSSFEPTQTQTPITRSVRSLTLPSRSVLNTQSFPQSVNAEDQTSKYPDTPTRTEEIQVSQFPFSPRIKSRKPLTTTLFLNKPETEMSKTLEASGARAEEEHFPQSMTKTGQIGVKAQQNSYSVLLRKYSSTEDIYLEEQITVNNTNLQNFSINKQKISQHATISPKDSTNFNIQQSGFNAQYLKSQSTQNTTARNSSGASTFTDRLNYSPRKDSSVDGISPTVGQIYLDSKKHSQSSQSSMDLSSPLSPSRPLRSVRVPSIYSYLRESSPAVSTPFPSTPSPPIQRAETLPPKQDGGVTMQSDQKTFPSRFSFDSPFVPEVQALQRNSYGSSAHTAPAQSLPPDFGRGSAPRLSTSPYSGLISSRPALNNTLQGLSSPPVSNIHTRSTSYDIVSTQADLIKGDPSSPLSTYTKITRRPKEQIASPNREQRTSVQAYTSTLDNHRPAQPCLSQTAPDASFVMESQSANINPHPRQPNTGSNNFPHQEHDGLTALQLDKGNAYPKQRMSEKEKYLLHNKLPVKNETPQTAEKKTTAGHMHEKLQEMQSPNSKKGLFASRVKKDNTFSSASLPEKEVVCPQYLKTKRHSPVFKTSSRIDQIINRLKLTFGVKRSESTFDTITKKNKPTTQKHSDTETFEKPKTEEKTYSGSQREPSISSLTTDKPSFSSLSPLTKSDNTINMDWQKSSTTEQKCSGCAWEAPNSSLTTDKPYFATFGSLSPPTLMKSENTLNMDWQNRSTTEQKCSGCTWEAPNSNLTTDQAYFTSFGSLSSLTLKRSSENKLNVDQQKRHSDETGNRSYSRSFSPHRIKAQSMNRSATLPNYRKSSVCPPSSPFYLFDFNSEDIHNDNVFYSPVSKKTNSLCESEDFSPLSSAKNAVQQNLARSRLSSSCADLKYGLHNGRSFSVSSVVSSRPSGPGRISTSSISDLSSLDDFVPKESYTVDSPVSSSYSPSYEPKSVSGKESQPGYTDDHLDHDDADPTPPPSPTLSSSPRRISQAPAMSSHMRTTSDNLSPPRGILPSRSYKTSLTVFEESGSDTTTDDEYYVDSGDDDEVETEL